MNQERDDRPAVRATARVLVVDDADRILLFHSHWDRRALPPRWVTPGGGIDAGETPHQAAVRELFEETGQRVDTLGEPVWHAIIPMPAAYQAQSSDATFYLWRTHEFDPIDSGWTDDEREDVLEWSWFDAERLRTSTDAFDPEDVRRILAAVTAPFPERIELDAAVVVRPLGERDWRLEQQLSEVADVPRFTYYSASLSEQAARQRAERSLRMRESGRGARYVIETADGAAGTAGVAREEGGIAVFYALLPAFRGRGLVTRSVRAFSSWAFSVGYPSVHLVAHDANAASIAVARRLGFVAERSMVQEGRAVTAWRLDPPPA